MIRRIFLEEGYSGIYAGLRPTLVMAIPNTVLYFSAYEEFVGSLRQGAEDPSASWIPLLAGGSARFLASTLTAPFEFLRTREASMVGHDRPALGMTVQFRAIVKTDGAGALFRGLRPTLLRDVPFSAIYWLCLERFRESWQRQSTVAPSPVEQAGQAFLNGATAGMIAAACTTPFDVVKTRQQAVSESTTVTLSEAAAKACQHDGAVVYEATSGLRYSTGTLAQMRSIIAKEGVAGLWRGNQARMLKVAPACAIMISCYEFGKRVLE